MQSLVTRLSPSKTEGRKESLLIIEWIVVDFWHLDQALPIRLRNRIMCTHDNLSILIRNLKNELVSTPQRVAVFVWAEGAQYQMV